MGTGAHPPNDYQRWLRHHDEIWNSKAGEVIHYLTRDQAHTIGLLPKAGDVDWWLFDDERLLEMHFQDGKKVRTVLTDDARELWAIAMTGIASGENGGSAA